MTVIVAVARDGAVVMAADTGSSDGPTRFAANPKIRRHGDILIATAGYAAINPALRGLEIPEDDDLDEWAQLTAEAITDLLAGRNPSLVTTTSADDSVGALQGSVMLARAGRVWYVDANLALPADLGVGVIGSGADIAYGATHTALNLGATPHQAARNAVEMACERLSTCHLTGGPVQVETLAGLPEDGEPVVIEETIDAPANPEE